MKTTMEKDTILFIDDKNRALGMNYEWYTKNYSKVVKDYGTPKKIFYKYGETVDNWIDFRRAVQIKQGGLLARIQAAAEDPLFHISDIREIPETNYYDREGFMHRIPAYDGAYNASHWVQRVDDPTLKQGYDYQLSADGNHLYVIFNKKVDLDNSIISLNGLFYSFEVVAENTIKFANIVDQLAVTNANMTELNDDELFSMLKQLQEQIVELNALINGEGDRLKNLKLSLNEKKALVNSTNITEAERTQLSEQINILTQEIEDTTILITKYTSDRSTLLQQYNSYYNRGLRREYMIKVNVYTWENITRAKIPVSPVSRSGEWFKLNVAIDENCFLFYKGQMLDYELSTVDHKSFRLKNVSLSSLDGIEIHKIMLYQMRSTETAYEIRKYVLKGHNNVHRNTVDFVLPIKQSLVVYEGIDHEYQITDTCSIVYDGTKWSPDYVMDSANVTSVNFTRVPLGL